METDFYEKLAQERQEYEAAKNPEALPPPFPLAVPVVNHTVPVLTAEDGGDGGDPAIKHDDDKPRYDLIPPEPLDGLARLYGLGAKKYADRNWEKGMKWSRVFAAMMRHAWKWWRGEDYDEKDGQHHLLSVIWCAMALYTYAVRRSGTDNRPPQTSSPVIYDVAWRVPPEVTDAKALN